MANKNLVLEIIILISAFTCHFSLKADKINIKDFLSDTSLSLRSTYDKLLQAHTKAIKGNKELDYAGIDTIRLTIPPSSVSIPLPAIIDFKHTVFIITNTQKNFTLFELYKDLTPLAISGNLNDINPNEIKDFEDKRMLLVIKDENPWVKERKGYGSEHIRRDIIILENGIPLNNPIQPYNTVTSQPRYSYRKITEDSIRIKNLTILRTKESTHKTFFIKIENCYNIGLSNISVITPKSEIYGDAIITLNNCVKVELDNIYINNTYSIKDKYGYGIVMTNVSDSKFSNIYGFGEWGIFGTNNLNQVSIENSDINRFDIHCYGKDVYCKNTHFQNLYNQFSSFYGQLRYEDCLFSNFVPVFIENTYSAYTNFNVYFEDCMITVDKRRPYLMDMRHSKFSNSNIRPELCSLEWPNLTVNNINIESSTEVDNYYLYHTVSTGTIDIDNEPNIVLNGIFGNFKILKLSNSIVKSKEETCFLP